MLGSDAHTGHSAPVLSQRIGEALGNKLVVGAVGSPKMTVLSRVFDTRNAPPINNLDVKHVVNGGLQWI